jgi:tRNA pseudouridine38-40 synthase
LAIGRHYAWYPKTEFQLDLMRTASACLIGEHSFEAFAKTGDANGSFDSIVYEVRWREENPLVHFEIEAIRYFHNMIRILIGTLIEVGRGKITPEEFGQIFEKGQRQHAGATAPAHGLSLVKIIY